MQINVGTSHIEELWDLGYLPLHVKSLPEGTLSPIGVPVLTIHNTAPKGTALYGWLTNYLETLLSTEIWPGITSATIAYEYKKNFVKACMEATGCTFEEALEMVKWQAHDFSMRGMPGLQASILSGMAHLTSFHGTDTVPAIYKLEKYYGATGLIGGSVPATEHSVQCMLYDYKGGEEDAYIQRMLDLYPSGIVSIVGDGFDFWKLVSETLPKFKSQIMSRDGKVVIRGDSGDPVDILCGTFRYKHKEEFNSTIYYGTYGPEEKGLVECLWDTFGGTINSAGYKVLDPHIGAIYGDSITKLRAKEIFARLEAKGFASTNVVLGIGSMTYTGGEVTQGEQYWVTRDLFGFAVKASYGEVLHIANESDEVDTIERREIYKDPKTGDGTKKSKKGLLQVLKGKITGDLIVKDQVSWEHESKGELQTIFKDGVLYNETNLEQIRARINENLKQELYV